MRLKIIYRYIAFSFLPLFLSLFYLQVIRGFYYEQLSEKNSIRTIRLGVPRGNIYDRNGLILASDRPSFNIIFVPYDLRKPKEISESLSPLLKIPANEIYRKLTKSYPNPFEPQILSRDISREAIAIVEESSSDLPGVRIQVSIGRSYPLGKKAVHLIGYLGEVNKRELKVLSASGIKSGDLIGKSGIEKGFDDVLRGKAGGLQIEVDARGHQVRELGKKEGTPGNNIILTIDKNIQEAASDTLGAYSGSVVVLDPRDGEVLALISNPSFDPNNILPYLKREDRPLFNRAVSGAYPPGSIFKIITEISALEKGVITRYDLFECKGEMNFGDRVFHCWNEEGHGWLNIDEALPQSCNLFFGQTGILVGARDLLFWARKFGLGNPTGIDIPGEKCGLIPLSEYSGGALNLSIGQGSLLVTPIQLANLIATVANGGNIWQPELIKEITSSEGRVLQYFTPRLRSSVFVSPETMGVLREGLRNVVVRGTGRNANIPEVPVCGKTGTAQTAHLEMELPTHGAFVAYAPEENPTVAICVFLDEASSSEAAFLAGRILKKIFSSKTEPQEDTD